MSDDAPSVLTDALGVAWALRPVGPAAWSLTADAPVDAALAHRLAALHAHVRAAAPLGVRDAIVGYRTLTLELRQGATPDAALAALRAALAADPDAASGPRTVVLPVAYGDAADRTELEARLGLPWGEIVRRHAGAEYTVAFLGFTPGFPYLLGLPDALALPRRERPRAMARGTVAIADGRAGVYPSAGPGGWWSLGTTSVALFDASAPAPARLLPGDTVRFVPDVAATGDGAPTLPIAPRPDGPGDPAPGAMAPDAAAPDTAAPAATVQAVWTGGATLQARPRAGVGHLGMAAAGALDPRAQALAAHVAGAPREAASLELAVPHADLRAERDLIAAWAGGGARVRVDGRAVPPGAPFAWPHRALLEVRPDPAVPGSIAYLAVAGGWAPAGGGAGHPALRGASTSTDVRAGVGGFGRALRAGDVLAVAGPTRPSDPRWRGRVWLTADVVLRLHRGPHGEDEAYAGLLRARFRLAARDRMGARLDGPKVAPRRPDVASTGVPHGTVQVPADGRPIVLLADRGRTGGYAIVGVVDPRDLPALAQARPGAWVVFEPPSR